jgi:hypothetical protein
MRNKLTKIEKSLSLHDISPMWARRLQNRLPIPFSFTWLKWYIEFKCASKCIVGEAYGFSLSYLFNCKECDRAAWKFMIYFTLHSHSKLEDTTQRFVKHWNEKHRYIASKEVVGYNHPSENLPNFLSLIEQIFVYYNLLKKNFNIYSSKFNKEYKQDI